MSRFPSPLRYPGGKNCIFEFVSGLFFENDLIGIDYAEPYAGGAGLALRLLFEEYVSNIYINDFDRSIYAFWKTVTENHDLFCDWIQSVSVDVDAWHFYKDIQNNSDNYDLTDLAKSTFFLNRTNVSGVIKGGIIGGFRQEGNFKIDARFNKDDLIKRIQKIAKYKNRINVSNLDGLAFIKKIDRRNKSTFIYLDPPYVVKGAKLYMNYYSKLDHQKLSEYVKKIKGKWMVSYDNNDFIIDLYKSQPKLVYQLSQSTSNRVGNEILIFSEFIKYNDSVKNLSQPVFL
jgi:DNA adenine methylase